MCYRQVAFTLLCKEVAKHAFHVQLAHQACFQDCLGLLLLLSGKVCTSIVFAGSGKHHAASE